MRSKAQSWMLQVVKVASGLPTLSHHAVVVLVSATTRPDNKPQNSTVNTVVLFSQRLGRIFRCDSSDLMSKAKTDVVSAQLECNCKTDSLQ